VRFSHVEPTSDEFFKTSDKSGGPIDPISGFREVYTEIYIRRARNPLKSTFGEESMNDIEEEKDGMEDAKEGDECDNEERKTDNDQLTNEKTKKKRGRKPKSFYLQQEQEKQAKEQMDKRKEEMQEAENEEEVLNRKDEYQQHALYKYLQSYSREMQDYIEEKKRLQQLKQQESKEEKASLFQTQKIAGLQYPPLPAISYALATALYPPPASSDQL